jgi:hypothetical protein
MKSIFLFLFLIILADFSDAQTCSISGTLRYSDAKPRSGFYVRDTDTRNGRPVKTILAEPDVNEIYVNLNDIRYGIYLFELKESGNNRIINRLRIIKY